MTFPASGPTVLTYSYDSGETSDQSGLNGDMGELAMSSSFSLSLSFQGKTVVIVQRLTVWFYARVLATGDGGNVVDKQITDTYTIGVDDEGQIVATLQSSVPVDNSETPSPNNFLNFFADVDTLSNDVSQWAQSCVATGLMDIPVSAVRRFVFPGGQTFSFVDARFSDNQDLVSHIIYADTS